MDIVYVCNNDYIYVLAASLESILSNKAQDDDITVHIMSPDLSEETKTKLLQMVNNRAKINFIKFDIELLDKAPKNFHKMAFAKFLIPNTFLKLDKILYIDVDTIIMGSLKELFNIDLGDNYAGMVEDMFYWKTLDLEENKKFYNNKYQDVKRWLNSGVILFNLKQCRKDKMQEKFIREMENVKHFFGDEPIFNCLFYGKVIHLAPKWNATPRLFHSPYKINSYLSYTKGQILEATYSPVIIHFLGTEYASVHHELRGIFSWYLMQTPWKGKNRTIIKDLIRENLRKSISKLGWLDFLELKWDAFIRNFKGKSKKWQGV